MLPLAWRMNFCPQVPIPGSIFLLVVAPRSLGPSTPRSYITVDLTFFFTFWTLISLDVLWEINFCIEFHVKFVKTHSSFRFIVLSVVRCSIHSGHMYLRLSGSLIFFYTNHVLERVLGRKWLWQATVPGIDYQRYWFLNGRFRINCYIVQYWNAAKCNLS